MKFLFAKKKEAAQRVALKDDAFFDHLIENEFSRIQQGGHTYLDYTGGNLYAESQVRKHHEMLLNNVLGNPHSTNPTSQLATQLVEESREEVLKFFNASDYYCVFTQNASTALKIVGECYPFDQGGQFVLLSDNHNSVNGIREYCTSKGGEFTYCPVQYEDLKINEDELTQMLESRKGDNKLFAFPAQSNVSGVKHDLEWVNKAQKLGWDVMLDAAAFVPTSRLDLHAIQPDFVSVSFYKIFGYPTGIGCLLIKKSKFNKLVKRWFAGGTVTLASVQSAHHYLANNHERYENGTINYLDIPAIKIGLDFINNIGMERITERVKTLSEHLCNELRGLKHANGKPLVKLFGPEDRSQVGGTLIMNFFDCDGNPYPFELIEREANKRKISIRSGCFCNPGIDEVNNCLTTDELATYFTSRDEGNYYEMIEFLNKMRGATRVSVGLSTSSQHLTTFVDFINGLSDKRVEDLQNS